MNIATQKDALLEFLFNLQPDVEQTLNARNLDVIMRIHDIGDANGLILNEIWWLYEGVRRVLAGEESPSNLVAFIQKDERIEEDNRPKIPALAYEIQQKIFDPVLPLLKQAGFPIKEGRVAPPPILEKKPGGESLIFNPSSLTPSTPGPSLEERGGDSASVPRSVQRQFSVPLEERNIRALTRIAAGTKYSEGELRETFEELPVGLRQSLSSVDTANAIQGVAKRYLLHVDQMASLASETGLVLLGLTHLADFVANLAKRLRLPEAEAKEIARDISAEIFVKVRDSLRGLHEDVKPRKENIESRISNIEKTQNTQQDASQLNAKRSTLTASLQTPFSAGAKWNTGDNILAKQAAAKEEPLSREEVLRGIENPRRNQPPTTNYQQPTTQGRMKTGGKAAADSGNLESRISNIEKTPNVQQDNNQLDAKPQYQSEARYGAQRYPPVGGLTASQKTRPSSESAFPPPKPKPDTEDFLDQKLQTPMTMPKEERRYTTDPYREPLQ